MAHPEISIIISTYNSVEWLDKTLIGYFNQNFKKFEIIIADDGSTPETAQAIALFQKKTTIHVIHVWHEDQGFQKTKILNKALLVCHGNYIIMTDGDCIPRKDFVETHNRYKKKGFFLSGGYFKLPMNISCFIHANDIEQQKCFDINWLKERGFSNSIKNKKLTARGFMSPFLNFITPTNASWNGHNSSAWKEDLLNINGFDERMQYGCEDRELGERLINNGIKSKQIRYSAICVHLDHLRGYVSESAMSFNKEIRNNTKNKKIKQTPFGIIKQEIIF